ncbi:hypothetical protein SPRG_14239 [Saprolegnia parasitica CBS 223.65]|uniref:Uncharacterized protein n=1 Tax=Saprolegnia parasitica (strain CBS 223.65) TaxID=695850 RepID=A0A067BYU7_SAPPC|nr:hypothetical protein SPRG_14239 [Saprolegnia parasitica CBS 223.65]KDO19712.1 hypothetical protein SPRG_14239 [Saprolegnia parasitica CBS 223.65]|eukprot:XP_012209571.1 hypothetical protein SPRG_14239 [Saprolegnia parasitica CBS 223.65]
MATSGASMGRPSPSQVTVVAASTAPNGQDMLTIFKSHPETMREATHGEFDPTNLECAIHNLVVSESLAHLTPLGWWLRADALYLERLKISPSLLAAFFHVDFGPRRLSLMHFKLCEQPEIDAWLNTLRASPRQGLPVPPTPSSIADIRSALSGLTMIVDQFGSESLQGLVRVAECAVSYLARMHSDIVATNLPALVRFLDTTLRGFRVAVIGDVVATPRTTQHEAVHKELLVGSFGLQRFISNLLRQHTFSLAHEMGQGQATELASEATSTKPLKTSRPRKGHRDGAQATPNDQARQDPKRQDSVVVVDNALGQKRRGRRRRSTVSQS